MNVANVSGVCMPRLSLECSIGADSLFSFSEPSGFNYQAGIKMESVRFEVKDMEILQNRVLKRKPLRLLSTFWESYREGSPGGICENTRNLGKVVLPPLLPTHSQTIFKLHQQDPSQI